MDLNGVENINFMALGGADNITVGDLTKNQRHSGQYRPQRDPGSGAGDGLADTVTVNGTGGGDQIQIVIHRQFRPVIGLAEQVNVTGTRPATTRW